MSLYEKNIATIKKLRPLLYQCLVPFFQSNQAKLVSGAGQDHNLELDINGKTSLLYDLAPNKDYERSLVISKLKRPRLLVFDGIGLGYHIFEYLKKPHADTLFYILVERRAEVFLKALELQDWTVLIESSQFEILVDLPENLMVTVMSEYLTLHDRITYSNSIEHFYFMPAMKCDGAYYVDFANSMKTAVFNMQGLYTAIPEDAYRGLMNVAENLVRMPDFKLIDNFGNAFKGKRALIVSTGPSLQFHLAALKEHQDKFLIASCDSAYKILLENNIKPHFVYCLERLKRQEELFKDIDGASDIPLITMPTVHPNVLALHKGPIFMAAREVTFGRWLWPEATFFNLGDNVASMALRTLVHMGCTDIYLIGQDFAYDRFSDRSHADGVSQETQDIERERRKEVATYCELEGNDGCNIPSTVIWQAFRETFKNMIARYSLNCTNVIPKNYGAKLDHAMQVDPEVFWHQKVPSFESQRHKDHVNALLDQAMYSQKNITIYKELFKNGIEYLGRLQIALLEFSDTMSYVMHAEFPAFETEALRQRYAKHLIDWQETQKHIMTLDSYHYEQLVRPLVLTAHMNNMTARENFAAQDHNLQTRVMGMAHLIHEWCSQHYFWSARIKKLLSESLYKLDS